MVINHAQFGRFDDDDDSSPLSAASPATRQEHLSPSQLRSESLVVRVDRLAKAVTDSHAVIHENGIAVDVKASGHVVAIRLDDHVLPGDSRLGTVLADMINRAREQAQAQVGDIAREVESDPRVARMVEQIHDAPDLEVSGTTAPADPEYDPDIEYLHGRSRIAAPEW